MINPLPCCRVSLGGALGGSGANGQLPTESVDTPGLMEMLISSPYSPPGSVNQLTTPVLAVDPTELREKAVD
ncbi:hypothetical protein [Bradyrhizobium sp. CCBAU 51627]|uniref:hypothetical protein n=1 Tax=Bradyrhizobium sp. CCBAU 51627 TaxID=1325088 RepID=UPI00230675FC|nr:hypothetical protein [Bradyrhizobium sp. CCBAU 51627]